MTLMSERIKANAVNYPNEIALSLNGKHLSFSNLQIEIDLAVYKCRALNLKSNDRVALVLPNLIETVVLFYALNTMGISVLMLHPLSSGLLIQQRCELMNCSAVFILDVLEKKYKPNLKNMNLILISASHSVPFKLSLLLQIKAILTNSTKRWDKVKPSFENSPFEPVKDAVILFSSGTSGHQKAIGLSNDAFNALVDQMIPVIEAEVGKDSMFCVLPFFHGFGLGIGMHTVLSLGGRCILVPRLTKNTMIKTLLKEKPTYLSAVPYLLKGLLKDKHFIHSDLSFIKQVFVGGETVPLTLIHEFNVLLKRQGSKAVVQVGYGCTETVTAVTLMDQCDSGKRGVGRPFIRNSIEILKDDGSLALPNEAGEIIISGPTLMNGYVNQIELNHQAFIEFKDKRYYKSGDIGTLDETGCLFFNHRVDDLIKVKGFMLSPLIVQDRLLKVNGIEDAKVFVDEEERLIAVLSLNDQGKLPYIKKETTQALKDLDGWCIPQMYVIVKSLPINEMRKSDLKALKEGIRTRSIEFLLEWSL